MPRSSVIGLVGQSSELSASFEMGSAEVGVGALSAKQYEDSAPERPAGPRWSQEKFEQRVGHVGNKPGPTLGGEWLEHPAAHKNKKSM